MHDLFGVDGITLGSLARAKKSEERVLQIYLHELRHAQVARGQAEVTFVRLGPVLIAMAREVYHVRCLDHVDNSGCTHGMNVRVSGRSGLLDSVEDALYFLRNIPKARSAFVVSILGSDSQKLDILRRERTYAFLRL
jgi:hypothetical protein